MLPSVMQRFRVPEYGGVIALPYVRTSGAVGGAGAAGLPAQGVGRRDCPTGAGIIAGRLMGWVTVNPR